MTLLTQYNPADEVLSLRQAMDRLFEDSFVNPAGWTTLARGQWAPAIDMWETSDRPVDSTGRSSVGPALQMGVTADDVPSPNG